MTITRCVICFVLVVLAACASAPVAETSRNSVLLISVDALRPADLERGTAPTLARLANEGVRADMRPSYPTLTFPNHYSIVTGLVPDHHGIVHNTMRDAALGEFKLSNRLAVGDSRWWGGEPIWVGAEKAGLRSAVLYWPGSEAKIAGIRPTRWRNYVEGQTLSLDQRVDTVTSWLSEPKTTRPRIAMMYFETVDKESHGYGPDSTQARTAVRTVDTAIGHLLRTLEARGVRDRVDVIVVSDHGMATVPRDHSIAVEDVVSLEEATVITIGQVVSIDPKPGFQAQVERKLIGAHDAYDCWRKSELPTRWRYGTHPRIPPIICQMHEGWDMLPRETITARPQRERGSHGYDPALPSMRAVFIANGPDFRKGQHLPTFDNVDVYPLLTRLLGITAAPNDGNPMTLLPALQKPPIGDSPVQ